MNGKYNPEVMAYVAKRAHTVAFRHQCDPQKQSIKDPYQKHG